MLRTSQDAQAHGVCPQDNFEPCLGSECMFWVSGKLVVDKLPAKALLNQGPGNKGGCGLVLKEILK